MTVTSVSSTSKYPLVNSRERLHELIKKFKKEPSPEEELAKQRIISETAERLRTAVEETTAPIRKLNEYIDDVRWRVAATKNWLKKTGRDFEAITSTIRSIPTIPEVSLLDGRTVQSLRKIHEGHVRLQQSIEHTWQSTLVATRLFDAASETARRLQQVFDQTAASFVLPAPASFGIQLPTHIDDICICADDKKPDEMRMAAANRLLAGKYRHPIASQRRRAHSARIEAGIEERAQVLRMSRHKAFHEAAQQALLVVCAELHRPRSRTCIVVNDRRIFDRDSTVWWELDVGDFSNYVKNRLSDQLMDILVPNWRQLETIEGWEKTSEFVSFSDEDEDACAKQDQVFSKNVRHDVPLLVSELLTHSALSEDQRMLMRLMIEEDLTETAAGLHMGKSESWGRVTISRIRQRLKKIS